jgi:hypothetical protein
MIRLLPFLSTCLAVTAFAALGTAQVRTGAFDRAIGNQNVGGAVHAHARTSFERSALRSLASAEADLRGNVTIFGSSTEAAEVLMAGSSLTSAVLPASRTGMFRVEMRGLVALNVVGAGSVVATTRTWAFQAFPTAVRRALPVGPVSITLSGNAACQLTTGGTVAVTAAPAVGLNGNASMRAVPQLSGAVSLPGMTLAVTSSGAIFDQVLTTSSGAAPTGLSGSTSYLLRAAQLRAEVVVRVLLTTWRALLVEAAVPLTSRVLI